MFNTDAFYALRGEPAWHATLTDHAGNVLGDLTYHSTERVSGYMAPFGGPDWRREFWRPEQISEALEWAEVPTVIRCKPPSYGENEAATVNALLNNGWSVDAAELNYAIPVPSAIDDYERTLDRQARHAIDAGEGAGFAVVEAGIGDDLLWAQGYRVLKDNREMKGRAISLTLDYVRAIRDAFPGLVRLLLAHRDFDIVAAALVYRVGAGRDVVQFWGDDPHAKLPCSPMNLLVREVVAHSIATGATRLDLGISTEGGEPNGGLCRFKRSIGATAELRFVLGR